MANYKLADIFTAESEQYRCLHYPAQGPAGDITGQQFHMWLPEGEYRIMAFEHIDGVECFRLLSQDRDWTAYVAIKAIED